VRHQWSSLVLLMLVSYYRKHVSIVLQHAQVTTILHELLHLAGFFFLFKKKNSIMLGCKLVVSNIDEKFEVAG
jgi:hypothetical protein